MGIGTLYRTVPRGREQLVSEALVGQATRFVESAKRLFADPDPWEGFVTLVTDNCDMQQVDAGFRAVLSVSRHEAPAASRRVVAHFLMAVGTTPRHAVLPDHLSSQEMIRAMTRLASAQGCAADSGPVAPCPGVEATDPIGCP